MEAEEEHLQLGGERSLEAYRPHYYRGTPPANLADPEYTFEDMHFLKALGGAQEPLTNLQNSVETMELVDEMYRAAGF